MNKLIEFFVKQKIFSDLISVFILVLGVSCLFLMNREAFPNIKFDVITVNTVFPGASPEEVEKLITNPLEVELKEVEGIKTVNSVSRTGSSLIILQLDPDQITEAEAKSEIQDVVDRFRDLPEDAEQPVVTALDGGSYPVIQVSLSSSVDPIELRQMAREIEKELEKLPDVAKVTPTGMRDLEILVALEPSRMNVYRLSFEEVVTALKNQNVSVPAGTIDDASGEEIQIRTSGDFANLEDVENAVIRANDLAQPIRIRDVAKVGFQLKKEKQSFRTNAEPAINLTVLRQKNSDSIKLVEAIKTKVRELEPHYAGKLNMRLVDDESIWIKMRLNTLSGNLIIGLILVLFVLSFLLPPVIAAMVAMGIPFAFLATMIVFYNIGYSLNLLSMLGLIIVVGMLVDDAVVATENSMRLFEEGLSAEDAAIKGTQQVVPAVIGSVLTTVLAFFPLMFMSGIFGKFVKFIPMGVIVALLISLLEAFFILPNHFARWMKRVQDGKKTSFFYRFYLKSSTYWDARILPRYKNLVAKLVYYRYRTVGGLLALFLLSILAASRLSFVLFPAEGIDIFLVTADAPLGSQISKTSELIRPVEKLILNLPEGEVQDFTTQLGSQIKDPGDPSSKYGSHLGMLAVYLTPERQRKRKADEIIAELRDKSASIPNLKIAFEKVAGGPPVGKAVSIGVQGNEYSEILKLAERIKNDVSKIEGTSDLELNYQLANRELRLDISKAEAAAAGLSVASIGQSVRAAFEGIVASSIKRLDEEIEIRVSLPDKAASETSTLERLLVPNAQGNLIPLGRVAKLQERRGVAAYIHENNQREIKVLGEIDTAKTDAGKVKEIIQEKISEYKKDFPGLSVVFGGENKDTEESLQSLMRTFAVAFIGILFVLVLTFQQLLQPLLVALTIPIGIISVLLAFIVHGAPLSFMGMLGIIALAGVIVNNAIVLVDFVNYLRREKGLLGDDSIVKAASMRLRPIFLTTVTTVVGVLPTAYGLGGEDAFVKPIALALGWGLLLGSVITVLCFPAMIGILDDFLRLFQYGRLSKLWRNSNANIG